MLDNGFLKLAVTADGLTTQLHLMTDFRHITVQFVLSVGNVGAGMV
jgi:hypothetical protein